MCQNHPLMLQPQKSVLYQIRLANIGNRYKLTRFDHTLHGWLGQVEGSRKMDLRVWQNAGFSLSIE